MQGHISAEVYKAPYRIDTGRGRGVTMFPMLVTLPTVASVVMAVFTALASPLALAEKPAAIYVGREKPQPREERYPHYRVLNQSSGYGYAGYGQSGYGRPQTDVNVQLRYQAPSTTIINNSVQIIPPSVPVGNISYSQDTYYINNAPLYPDYHGHPHRRRYVNNAIQDDGQPEQPVQDRSRQWTEDIGITPP